MIDIHHHLLSGLDDGATSMDISVAMARIAAADGITHVVCTPHANGQYAYDRRLVEEKIAELQWRLDEEKIPLKLGRGCDFHMSYDNIQEAQIDPGSSASTGLAICWWSCRTTGCRGNLTETFYQLQLAGLTPILTHPERNPTLQTDEPRMMDWLRGGVLVQVTAGSVTGQDGESGAADGASSCWRSAGCTFWRPMRTIRRSRPPQMREAFELVAEKYGQDYAHTLCVTNPLAVFMGKTDAAAG